MLFKVANLAQLAEYDEIIDVRSPSEYDDDHIPGAISCPVLDDEERARVGTLYCQESPFAARRVGAALVARNIAHHIETRFLDRPKSWKPLIYCWRGGQRSGAMAIIMGQIGWAAHRLDKGYKGYRQQVLADLDRLPATFDFRVLSGPTGSGKSRLLAVLATDGRQIVDLEGLARHRGSVLGALPDMPQPGQRAFETALRQSLLTLDPARPVYVEAESRSIGRVTLPGAMLDALRRGSRLRIEAPIEARVALLLEDYDFLVRDPALLLTELDRLRPFYPRATLDAWQRLVRSGQFDTLVRMLLERHYDPLYRRSSEHYGCGAIPEQTISISSLETSALRHASAMLNG
jgi:tRNA 2-selenouridine synthase